METYEPEEVKQLIEMLKSLNSKAKKSKDGELTKIEKQIRYLEQRLKFFNPTKEMLSYIINQAEKPNAKINPALLEKLKNEYAKKS